MMLNAKHLKDLRRSMLTDETIARYNIESVEKEYAESLLGYPVNSGGWLIRYPNSSFLKFKPDEPVSKKYKYLSPLKTNPDFFLTTKAQSAICDPTVPYYFVEGEKKAMCMEQLGLAAISIQGVWGWSSRGHDHQRLAQLNLESRICVIVFDADKYKNNQVMLAQERFAETLVKYKARPHVIDLDPAMGKGFDDQALDFQSRGNLDELLPHYNTVGNAWVPDQVQLAAAPEKEHVQIAVDLIKQLQLVFSAERFWQYNNDTGVFTEYPDLTLQKELLKYVGAEKYGIAVWREVEHAMKALAYRQEMNVSEYLNVKNGMYCLETHQLLPHEPKYLSTIQLNVSYDPQAQCPRYLKFLEEVFKHRQGLVNTALEFCGYCLTKDVHYEKAMILYGGGENGKGVFTRVLRYIVGEANVSNVELEMFGDRHYLAELYGKLINIAGETGTKTTIKDAILKSAISGETLTVDRKYEKSFTFPPFTKFIFSTNNLPYSEDHSHALYRRLIILPFDETFSGDKRDVHLFTKLKEEADGIFMLFIEALKDLRKRGGFAQYQELDEQLKEYQASNNPVIPFVYDRCDIDSTAKGTTSGTLYQDYQIWCKKNGHLACSKINFLRQLYMGFPELRSGRVRVGGHQPRVVEGLLLRPREVTVGDAEAAWSTSGPHPGVPDVPDVPDVK